MLAATALHPASLRAQEPVSFATPDSGVVSADVYGRGARAVVLAPGGRFDKRSWAAQARTLADAGFRVLAHASIERPERLRGRTLFLVSSGDTTAAGVPRRVTRAPSRLES